MDGKKREATPPERRRDLSGGGPPTKGGLGRTRGLEGSHCDELFGNPTTPPTKYHCPDHGDVLAQDVVWKRGSQPCCPECGGPAESV